MRFVRSNKKKSYMRVMRVDKRELRKNFLNCRVPVKREQELHES